MRTATERIARYVPRRTLAMLGLAGGLSMISLPAEAQTLRSWVGAGAGFDPYGARIYVWDDQREINGDGECSARIDFANTRMEGTVAAVASYGVLRSAMQMDVRNRNCWSNTAFHASATTSWSDRLTITGGTGAGTARFTAAFTAARDGGSDHGAALSMGNTLLTGDAEHDAHYTAEVAFTFGQPFTWGCTLAKERYQWNASLELEVPCEQFRAAAAEFSFNLIGVEIRDAAGQPVPHTVVRGASGRVYLPRGDANGDGAVDNFDIEAFVLAVSDPAAFNVQFPDSHVLNADANGDGVVNNFDIDPFIAAMSGR